MENNKKQFDLSIVLPTFNEKSNVAPIVTEIRSVLEHTDISYEIIFVDDSTDDTPEMISRLQGEYGQDCIKLIHRAVEDRNGLGGAILLGLNAANSDYICTMDSDLQHPPSKIIEIYSKLKNESIDLVVASRMIEDGSNEGLENKYRVFVSQMSRLVANIILPLTKKTTDPMTGYFGVRRSVLSDGGFQPIGFKILVELLARIPSLRVADVPFVMRKRQFDDSKASFREGMRYVMHLCTLAYETRIVTAWKYCVNLCTMGSRIVFKASVFLVAAWALYALYSGIESVLVGIIVTVSFVLTVQGLYALFLMIYAWENPERAIEDRSPKLYSVPKLSFTTLLPVRHETEVVTDTIKAVADMNYPGHLTEVKVICSDDDVETISVVRSAIANLGVADRVGLVIYDHSNGTSKPKAMNVALAESTKDVVVIFDAEDEPHKDIFNIVNTVMLRDNADVVQSGVQLMNYRSNWFSMFNVMEYYFWFKSALHFYARAGVIPLGGNTVFFNRAKLEQVGGWDEQCLTEDGDVGLRLSAIGANIRVVYDEQHVTQEETPPTALSFIKQRTRWNQGFLQILFKGEWLALPTWRQRMLAVYVFTWPIVNALLFIYVPFSIYIGMTTKMPVQYAMIANLPMYIVILHFVTFSYGLYQFTRDYKLSYPIWLPVKSFIFYYPYQIMLGVGALRAVFRLMQGNLTWEKTEHTNAHRVAKGGISISSTPEII